MSSEFVELPLPESESKKLSKDKFVVWASGDSMSPEIEVGDLTVVDTAINATHNALVVVSYRGELFIKRLIEGPTGKLLHSNNIRYADIAIEQDTQIVGVIVWVCKKKYNINSLITNLGQN